MTTKEMVIKEIEKLSDTDPLLQVIWEILQHHQSTVRKAQKGHAHEVNL